jgi:hypothetical protein
MGFPVAQVADLALCLAFHVCTVSNGYQQRVKLCANSVTVSPEQQCPKIEQQQQTVVAGAPPPVVQQIQPTVVGQAQQVQPTVVGQAAAASTDASEMASNDE